MSCKHCECIAERVSRLEDAIRPVKPRARLNFDGMQKQISQMQSDIECKLRSYYAQPKPKPAKAYVPECRDVWEMINGGTIKVFRIANAGENIVCGVDHPIIFLEKDGHENSYERRALKTLISRGDPQVGDKVETSGYPSGVYDGPPQKTTILTVEKRTSSGRYRLSDGYFYDRGSFRIIECAVTTFEKGERVLVECTVLEPVPDDQGHVELKDDWSNTWAKPKHIRKLKESQ